MAQAEEDLNSGNSRKHGFSKIQPLELTEVQLISFPVLHTLQEASRLVLTREFNRWTILDLGSVLVYEVYTQTDYSRAISSQISDLSSEFS